MGIGEIRELIKRSHETEITSKAEANLHDICSLLCNQIEWLQQRVAKLEDGADDGK